MIFAAKKIKSIEELYQLIGVFAQAFEADYSKPEDSYFEAMLNNSACVLFGAFFDSQVVGGLVAFEMMPIHGKKEFYIYDIAVHPEFQKKGIGTLLMKELQMEARKRGISTLFVEAESEDRGAVAFYRAIGGEEVAVNHFNFNAQ